MAMTEPLCYIQLIAHVPGAARSRPSNGCSIYTCTCLEGSERSKEPAKHVSMAC